MKRSLIVVSVSLFMSLVLVGEAADHPWMNKSLTLDSTEHFQFLSPVSLYSATVTIKDGKMEQVQDSSTSATHTVVFQTESLGKEKDGVYRSYYTLRILDEEWSPENNRKVLENIAGQIKKGFELPLEIGRKKNEDRHRLVLLLIRSLSIFFSMKTGSLIQQAVFVRDWNGGA
jgi:hypothetical protein